MKTTLELNWIENELNWNEFCEQIIETSAGIAGIIVQFGNGEYFVIGDYSITHYGYENEWTTNFDGAEVKRFAYLKI